MKHTIDPAWADAQYNNRKLVPDAAERIARWTEASRVTRERSEDAVLDLAYGPGDGERLDVFPATRADAPILIFIHGGYWRALDKSDHSFVAASFNADGAMVVVPNYALCPAVTVEHITLQLTRAVAWTWRNARRFGGDPNRIAVVGHSAGGHAAAMLVSCRWKDVDPDLPLRPISGALSISGLYDLEPLRHTTFLQPDLKLTPASVARLSPAFFPRPKVPLYVTAGADESAEFVRQNSLIRDVWGPTAVPVCETIPRTNHFTVLAGLADPGGRLHELALRLLGLR